MRGVMIGAVLLWVGAASVSAQNTQPSAGISGIVRYPDGTPAAGATVSATTACREESVSLSRTVKSSSDGSFFVPALGSGCGRVRLSANKAEEFWLETGHYVFYTRENGTTPVVEVTPTGHATAEITLGERGGLVHFRVWDRASKRFIWAGLYLKRVPPVPRAKFVSMQIATGRDGSAHTRLLPAGEYEVVIKRFECKQEQELYFAASRIEEKLRVEAGQTVAMDISVDVRRIKPMKSYNNLDGAACAP